VRTSKKAAMVHNLAPFNPPLGPQPLNAYLYSPKQVTLQMKEKVFRLSGDNFNVKTTEGVDVLKIHGKMVSAHDKKLFTDMQDNELFTLKNKLLSMFKSFHAESPHGKHDFEVKGHFKAVGSRSTVTFKNASDGNEIELEIKGDWIDRSADITMAGRPVAHISRSFFNVREIFGDKQTVSQQLCAFRVIQ